MKAEIDMSKARRMRRAMEHANETSGFRDPQVESLILAMESGDEAEARRAALRVDPIISSLVRVGVDDVAWRAKQAIEERKVKDPPMKHDCRGEGWLTKITNAIELASDGDTLVVASDAAQTLAFDARDRMRPGLDLVLQVEALENPSA